MFNIDENIPFPAKFSWEKAPWDKMKVGDSFWIDESSAKQVASACDRFGRRLGRVFIYEAEKSGHRVWLFKTSTTQSGEKNMRKRIFEVIRKNGGEITEGILVNKIRSVPRAQLEQELEMMVNEAEISVSVHEHPKRKIKVIVYKLIE